MDKFIQPISSVNATQNRGNNFIGVVKKTKDQKKKHIEQMSGKDVESISDWIRSLCVEELEFSNHLNRNKEMSFDKDDIIHILKSSELDEMIIEYNETMSSRGEVDCRVLLRGLDTKDVIVTCNEKKQTQNPSNLCFVLSLTNNRIVTAYWNKSNDSHKTIDWKRYDKSLIVRTYG